MLYTVVDDQITPLATHLAKLLAHPLTDPFAPEWIAVPTVGMQRWLALQLAKTLGSSGSSDGDGVAMNLGITFPGALRTAVLDWQGDEESSHWGVDRLVWMTLAVLSEQRSNPAINTVTDLPEGCTWYSRARQIADLFDRYSVRRPNLLRAWAEHHDNDSLGARLEAADRWQPILWRQVKAMVNRASPAEQLPVILEGVRSGTIDLDLPPRVVFFGLTTFPNGNEFLDLVDAVALRRDVYLYLLDPALKARKSFVPDRGVAPDDLLRAHDNSEALIQHPLLRSWGRPYRERTILLERAIVEGRVRPEEIILRHGDGLPSRPSTLLQKVQSDIARDLLPDGAFTLDERDTSIQIHSCYGELRQVEALRSAILHQLQADPTLDEEEIVVLCPDIVRFAPLIEAGLGPSQDDLTATQTEHGPRLHWRISDRSLRPHQGVSTALLTLLQIANSQASASEILTFFSLAPVCKRFDLVDDDIATIEHWVQVGHVRWGFDSEQRTEWSLSAGITQGTWEELVDRLLLGSALDDAIELAPGGIAAIAVNADSSELLGKFADLIHRLRRFVERSHRPRSITEWCTDLNETVVEFFAADEDGHWQIEQTLAHIAKVAESSQDVVDHPINGIVLSDVMQLLRGEIEKIGGRSNFFRGGITITSLLPLRWIPYRVICLLGLDEESLGTVNGGNDGDDLIARNPQIGDRDPRSEQRQALLEALMAAQQSCIITHAGRSITTNHRVPPATVVAELTEVLRATIDHMSQPRLSHNVIRIHDRHSFSSDEFISGRYVPNLPWSFSRADLQVAQKRNGTSYRSVKPDKRSRLEDDLTGVIEIDRLTEFVKHPVKFYFSHRLQLAFPAGLNEFDERLPVDLTGLAAWEVADHYITSKLSGIATQSWQEHERALGTTPVGSFGDRSVDQVRSRVDAMFDRAMELGLDLDHQQLKQIAVVLSDGTQIRGSVPLNLSTSNEGTLAITYSRTKEEHHLVAWIRLMALVATDASIDWKSIVISRDGRKISAHVLSMGPHSAEERESLALEGLSVAADLYRRALCEPLPLFGNISKKIHRNDATPDDWFTFYRRGPGDDRINQLAFGPLGLGELLALPVEPHDPSGSSASRARRFADYLWSCVERTSVSNV